MATDYLTKIQALLNKAESTEFEAEAESFMAKAQELMTIHAIDEAMLAKEGKSDEVIVHREVNIPDTYTKAKVNLLAHICDANGVKMVIHTTRRNRKIINRIYVLVGWESDVENSVALFAALLMHGTRLMLATRPDPGENTKSFRQAFLVAYGSRIGARLQAAKAVATAQATETHGSSTALAIIDRSSAVEDLFAEAYGNLGKINGPSYSANSGVGHGTQAAESANLGQTGVGSAKRSLNA